MLSLEGLVDCTYLIGGTNRVGRPVPLHASGLGAVGVPRPTRGKRAAIGQQWVTKTLSAAPPAADPDSPPAAGPAVAHDGYTSEYTVDSNGDLEETFLTAAGQPWTSHDLSALAHTPAVMPGTKPEAVAHNGYTSVYTIDAVSGHLWETYLPALGAGWTSQDLTGLTSGPAALAATSPAVVFHDGYTSVYTVDDPSRDLQETYLPAIGDERSTQDMTAKFGAPTVAPGTVPAAIYHTGSTSVYTVDQGSGDLQETFLPAIGEQWVTQDLSAKTSAPPTAESPVAVVHADASGGLTWTSVYTIDEATDHLRETYLQALGDGWVSKDLTPQSSTPPDAATEVPTAGSSVAHSGYTSVYTVATNGDLWETYQTETNFPWVTQDLTTLTGMPAGNPGTSPVAVFHDGYVSVYTFDGNGDLQETYLPALGDAWKTQDLTAVYHLPATLAAYGPVALYHTGYTSVYTVDIYGQLWETYLPAIGDAWTAVDMTTT